MAGPRSTFETINVKETLAEFGTSGFFRAEIISGLSLCTPEFTIPIHPIFARANFKDTDNYDSLLQALQLTSAFLMAGLPFFHAILVGNRTIKGRINRYGRCTYSFPDPLETLTDGQKAAMWELMEIIAGHVTFHVDSHVDANARCGSADETSGCFRPHLPGCGSQIWIGKGLYDSIVKAYASDDLIAQQALSFDLAATLIHEFTHAAFFAATPEPMHHIPSFFVGQQAKTNELGFELEAYLFGNVVLEMPYDNGWYYDKDRDCVSSLDHLLTFCEYPCPAKIKLYDDRSGHAILTRGELQRNYMMLWNASFLYIHKMFSDSFWSDQFAQHGRKAMQFERDLGYRFIPNGQPRPEPYSHSPMDVPEGFSVVANGQVLKIMDADERESNVADGSTTSQAVDVAGSIYPSDGMDTRS